MVVVEFERLELGLQTSRSPNLSMSRIQTVLGPPTIAILK